MLFVVELVEAVVAGFRTGAVPTDEELLEGDDAVEPLVPPNYK